MILTYEILHSAASNQGGFNREQLALLGVSWPPVKGWLRSRIGHEIDDSKWELIMKLKGVPRKQRTAIIKGQQTIDFSI